MNITTLRHWRAWLAFTCCSRSGVVLCGASYIWAHAGAPLVAPESFKIGIFGQEPRAISQEDAKLLKSLAAIAMEELKVRQANVDLNQMAMFDALTGLPNRVQFQYNLAEACRRAGTSGKKVVLGQLDLNQFKRIKGTFRHAASDTLLRQMAEPTPSASARRLTPNAGPSNPDVDGPALTQHRAVPSCPVVVIGGSAGALEALLRVVAQLSPSFSAPIVIVIHSFPEYPSCLPEILSRAGPLPARHVRSEEPLLGGHLYVAPPDRHLLVNDDVLVVSRGPKDNHSRPSIDVTMRSAAATWGSNVIGVLLSGMLDDGTSGLSSIQQAGGRTLVQNPEEALFPSMPLSALQQVRVSEILPSTEIAGRLEQLIHDWTLLQ